MARSRGVPITWRTSFPETVFCAIQAARAALSAPGQPEGTSEPSDFDALLEHHKATEAENALFKRALEYIVRRGYHGASFVADKALAGIDVTAALSAPGQPEGER